MKEAEMDTEAKKLALAMLTLSQGRPIGVVGRAALKLIELLAVIDAKWQEEARQ